MLYPKLPAIFGSRRLMRIADLHKLVESPCARWVGWWEILVSEFGGTFWWDVKTTGPISNEFDDGVPFGSLSTI